MQHSPGFLALVTDARTRIKECGVADVRARLDRGERLHFVDVREDGEFAVDRAAGGSPGSRRSPGGRRPAKAGAPQLFA